jgi:hypothetical protein
MSLRKAHGQRLHRAPGAEREACPSLLVQSHRAGQRADREQAAAEADQRRANLEQQGRAHRRGQHDQREGAEPDNQPVGGQTRWVPALAEQMRGRREGGQRAARHQRGEQRRLRDAELQDLAAIGLKHDVLHVERGRSARHRQQEAPGARRGREAAPDLGERRCRRVLAGMEGTGALGVARLLLPDGGDVEHNRDHSRALDDLDQPQGREIDQQQREDRAAGDHAQQQHRVHQRHDPRAHVIGRQIGRESEARRLRGLQTGPCQQESQRGCGMAGPPRRVSAFHHQQQRERHDGEATKLQQRAVPEIGQPPDAEGRAVRVGLVADQRAERREQQRDRHHHRDQRGRHAELDDHDAVERADQQNGRHADGDLEQGEAQEPAKRQPFGRGIRERQEPPRSLRPLRPQLHQLWSHVRVSSRPCEM